MSTGSDERNEMIGNILYKVGRTLFPAVGPVHDALDGSVETPVLNSDSIEMLELQSEPVMPGSVANTIYYYIGGTAVVVAVVTLLACKGGKLMKAKAKPRRRKRTTTKRSTAAARRRGAIRSNYRKSRKR